MLNLYHALKSFPPFSRQLTCRGMLFTNYECPQEDHMAQLYVDHSFILYVVSGRRIYHKQKRTWELKEGSCAFVKKGGYVAEKPKGEEWCVMAFFVPDDFLVEIIKDNRSLTSTSTHQTEDDALIELNVSDISKSCLFSMLPYFSQFPPPLENLVELKFKELVLSLFANPANKTFVSFVNELKNNNTISLRNVMQSNFSFNLSISDYAKLSCKSVSAFKREFKKHFNETPSRWVMKKRMELAEDLLANTSQPVAEVSFECGFENPTHFSRVFKEKTGVAPLQFRQSRQIHVS